MSSTKISAPEFCLRGPSSDLSLKDLQGTPSVLVFYPENNTKVCSSQLALYNEILPMFEEYNAKIVGISVDDRKSHEQFAKKLELNFPLLSDSEPLGEVAKKFNVFDERIKRSKRALFVLDGDGNIRWSQVVPYNINPGADGILKALEDLSKSDQ